MPYNLHLNDSTQIEHLMLVDLMQKGRQDLQVKAKDVLDLPLMNKQDWQDLKQTRLVGYEHLKH